MNKGEKIDELFDILERHHDADEKVVMEMIKRRGLMLERENAELKKQICGLNSMVEQSYSRAKAADIESAELKRVNNKLIRTLHHIKEKDFEQIDRVCEMAGVHKFSLMKADIEDALESAKVIKP